VENHIESDKVSCSTSSKNKLFSFPGWSSRSDWLVQVTCGRGLERREKHCPRLVYHCSSIGLAQCWQHVLFDEVALMKHCSSIQRLSTTRKIVNFIPAKVDKGPSALEV